MTTIEQPSPVCPRHHTLCSQRTGDGHRAPTSHREMSPKMRHLTLCSLRTGDGHGAPTSHREMSPKMRHFSLCNQTTGDEPRPVTAGCRRSNTDSAAGSSRGRLERLPPRRVRWEGRRGRDRCIRGPVRNHLACTQIYIHNVLANNMPSW